ncbi:MAG: hydrolase [Patescibacteria group bacterium]|mgnify:CR=1 FL=1
METNNTQPTEAQAPVQAQTPAPQVTEPTAAQSAQPATAATPPATSTPAPIACKCPNINPAEWDKKKMQLNKSFYKTYSLRIFNYPFAFTPEVYRAFKGAQQKGYNPVENGMILDTGGMFLGDVMVEVTSPNLQDKNVISLAGKELYTKVSRRPQSQIKQDIAELVTEIGKQPFALYFWWTSCPNCQAQKEAKTVLIAVV